MKMSASKSGFKDFELNEFNLPKIVIYSALIFLARRRYLKIHSP